MDQFLLSVRKRVLIPVVFLGALIIWFFLCQANYQSYWYGTIHRVQTTDFNLLHHMLPTTLSQQIIAGRDDQVQKTLDSTFGLFGAVVTDPSGQTILYRTVKTYLRPSWQLRVTPELLLADAKKEPPDALTDPPPLEAAWEYKTPRDHSPPPATSYQPSARKIIGYVHYLRPDPPPFVQDITSWVTTGIWEVSGAKRGYFLITLCTISFSLVLILLVWLRQRVIEVKQIELVHIQRELDIRKKALEHLSQELTTQKARKTWLEREAEESQRRAISLKQALEKLRDSLALVNAQSAPAGSISTQLPQRPDVAIRSRPSSNPPSAILEEIERLIPALADNAGALKSQASLLTDYCNILETRQTEMKRIVEQAYTKSQSPGNVLDMRPS